MLCLQIGAQIRWRWGWPAVAPRDMAALRQWGNVSSLGCGDGSFSCDMGGGALVALQVVLMEPEIPPNTGNVSRTCVVTGSVLHLVRPLGFSLEDRYLRRAGLDYWRDLDLHVHDDWDACRAGLGERRLHLFTAHGTTAHTAVRFGPNDALVFGRESSGLPQGLLAQYPGQWVRIPLRPGQRSLNLGNAVAIGVYEALRQLGFPGLV